MTALCPNCGLDFERDGPIEIDGFVLNPRGLTTYNGAVLPLSPSQGALLHSVAKAGGEYITMDALLNRVSSSEGVNLVSVVIFNIKKKLAKVGAPFPLINSWGKGYRWAPTTGVGIPDAISA